MSRADEPGRPVVQSRPVEVSTLAEFMAPRLQGIERVVEVRTAAPIVNATLNLAPATKVEILDPTELGPGLLGNGDLLICSLEADDAGLLDPGLAERCLTALGPGGSFGLILAGAHSLSIDSHLIRTFAAVDVELLQIGLLAGDQAGVVLAGSRGPADVTSQVGGQVPTPAALADARREAEIRRLKRMLAAADGRVAAVEGSTSFRIGKVAVDVARQRHRLLRRVPAGLRGWREGRQRPSDAPGRARAVALEDWHQSIRFAPERLHLAYSNGSPGPRSGLVLAALVRDETAATLETQASVHRLYPNTALMTIERVDPDLVLVESGAFSAGGPWAYTAGASALDRDRVLMEVLAIAHEFGRPSVLWMTAAVPEPIGLSLLERQFDLLLVDPGGRRDSLGWTPGVPLSVFNALDLDPGRSGSPLYVGDWDPRAARADQDLLQRLLTAGARRGLEILVDARSVAGPEGFPAGLRASIHGVVDPAAAAGLYRSRPVVFANPGGRPDGLRRALEAVACGARIVAPTNPDLDPPRQARRGAWARRTTSRRRSRPSSTRNRSTRPTSASSPGACSRPGRLRLRWPTWLPDSACGLIRSANGRSRSCFDRRAGSGCAQAWTRSQPRLNRRPRSWPWLRQA